MIRISRGFTLIEVVITLLIVGLLSSVVVTKYSTIQIRAKERVLQSMMNNIQLALESYYLSHSKYPSGSNVSISDIELELVATGDLASIHVNPFTGNIFSESDSSGLVLYSYNEELNIYRIDLYGYLNENALLIIEN